MTATTTEPSAKQAIGVPAEISRSWLLHAADRSNEFDSAGSSGTDQLVIDLEDAVDASRKNHAREEVTRWLATGGTAWVRINDSRSEFWRDDIDQLCGATGLRGVMLAKTESPADVEQTFELLGGGIPVMALIESAVGIEEATAIARARGTFRLAFGSGDYRRDTGTSADDLAMAYPRSRLVVASRVAGLPGPIDGPTVGSDSAELHAQTTRSARLGMTGKLCLHAEQPEIVNTTISPDAPDIAWALEFLADFEARGRAVRDGSDLPRLGRAERITGLARAYGLMS